MAFPARMVDRRLILRSAAAAALGAAGLPGRSLAQQGLRFGASLPFSFEALKDRARAMAGAPYAPAPRPAPEVLQRVDYDAHGKIKFRTDLALWADGRSRYPVTFFHLGRYFQSPVRMYVAERGAAREILYDPSYFDMPVDSPARGLPENSGFAGFRFQESRAGDLDWRKNDWVAFLGASYFRAIGQLHQYGLSARGVALDTVMADRPEEFPDFTRIYIGPEDGVTVTVHALLEGPSITGAYQFTM